MMRKHEKFHPQISKASLFNFLSLLSWLPVELCLKFMLEVDDDEEWSTTDDIVEDEDSSR